MSAEQVVEIALSRRGWLQTYKRKVKRSRLGSIVRQTSVKDTGITDHNNHIDCTRSETE